MGKVHIIFILISSLVFLTNAQELQNLHGGREKLVKLHVYIQDVLTGPNATVYEIARANITSISPTSFGRMLAIDDLITAEPAANSKMLGRAQGHITFTDLAESAFTLCMNFLFTAGKYNGSTLSALGRNPTSNNNRELPIVGGTGVFRWARGYIIANTYSFDPITQYTVLEYIFNVLYRED